MSVAAFDHAKIAEMILRRLSLPEADGGCGLPVFTAGESQRTATLQAWAKLVRVRVSRVSGFTSPPGGDDAAGTLSVVVTVHVDERVLKRDLCALQTAIARVCRSLERVGLRDEDSGHTIAMDAANGEDDDEGDPPGFGSGAVFASGVVHRDTGRSELRAPQWNNPA